MNRTSTLPEMISRKGTSGLSARDLPPLMAAVLLPLIPIVQQSGLLAAIPLLALIIPLICGRFPGETVIERLAAPARSTPRLERRFQEHRPRPAGRWTLLRTRLLIAASFAERPPPAISAI